MLGYVWILEVSGAQFGHSTSRLGYITRPYVICIPARKRSWSNLGLSDELRLKHGVDWSERKVLNAVSIGRCT